jgi:hypothetical protein
MLSTLALREKRRRRKLQFAGKKGGVSLRREEVQCLPLMNLSPPCCTFLLAEDHVWLEDQWMVASWCDE